MHVSVVQRGDGELGGGRKRWAVLIEEERCRRSDEGEEEEEEENMCEYLEVEHAWFICRGKILACAYLEKGVDLFAVNMC